MNDAKNKFGFWMLLSLVIGNTIGAGIFMLPASLAKIGSISLLSWVFTSAGAILFALIFARMSRMVTKTGGPYAYAHTAFGEFTGFQVAFTFWVSLWTGNSSLVITLISYLRIFFPNLVDPMTASLVGIGIIWLMAIINISGVRTIGNVQIITTIIKLIPVLLIIGIGLCYFHPEYITQSFNVSSKSNFSAFSYAATLTLWGFVGMEAACIPVSSTTHAERNIRRATIIGILILAAIYITTSIAIMGLFPNAVLTHAVAPFAMAANLAFGGWGQLLVNICIVISCLGALNSGLLLEGQIPMAAADDGLFPKIFAKRNRFGMPAWGLFIDAALMSGFILLTMRPDLIDQFQLVVTVASVATLIAYLYSAIAEIVLLARKGEIAYKKISASIAILGAIYAIWAIFGAGKEIIFYTAMLFFGSLLLYSYIFWQKQKRIAEEAKLDMESPLN